MPPHRRLVRRQPFSERIKSYLNPYDFLLWLSEELETSDWEQWQREWGTLIGIGTNIVMLVARANSGGRSSSYDDVFADDSGGSSLLTWFVCWEYIKLLDRSSHTDRRRSSSIFSHYYPSSMLSTLSGASDTTDSSRRLSTSRQVLPPPAESKSIHHLFPHRLYDSSQMS